jgi:hypothetical protein
MMINDKRKAQQGKRRRITQTIESGDAVSGMDPDTNRYSTAHNAIYMTRN